MIYLRYATASQEIPLGYFVDSTNGDDEETGLTIANTDIKLWKTGATTLANKNSGGATHISNGIYYATLDATDTNTLGSMVIFVHVAGALTVRLECCVLPVNIYDSWIAGTDYQDVNTTQIEGSDATDQIRDSIVNDSTRIDASALNTLSGHDPGSQIAAQTDITGLNDPTSAAIADAVWDEAKAGHVGVGSFGEEVQSHSLSTEISALNDISSADVQSACDSAITANANVSSILADTNELQTDWTNGGRLDLIIDELTTQGDTNEGKLDTITTHCTDMKGGTFNGATDSLEAIRDRGDAAWTTGGGGSITDILNIQPIIPGSIDLANTATVRLGVMLTNALDDLPSTAEITPGTIDIDRKAIGGTSWTSILSGAACSEQAGLIYYDEVFDSGTGYAEGDSIRITFKGQKIVVAANDYEITDANGVSFQTEIRQTMRGTDSAATVANIIAGITDGTLDLQEMLRIMFAALAGKSSGGGTTNIKFRNSADNLDRIDATVDADGNRTSVTLNGA